MSVMLAVIITFVPVVALVADDDVVTELTEALTVATENKSEIRIENIKILFFIFTLS